MDNKEPYEGTRERGASSSTPSGYNTCQGSAAAGDTTSYADKEAVNRSSCRRRDSKVGLHVGNETVGGSLQQYRDSRLAFSDNLGTVSYVISGDSRTLLGYQRSPR